MLGKTKAVILWSPLCNAERGTWTLLVSLQHEPEPCASANSAISANKCILHHPAPNVNIIFQIISNVYKIITISWFHKNNMRLLSAACYDYELYVLPALHIRAEQITCIIETGVSCCSCIQACSGGCMICCDSYWSITTWLFFASMNHAKPFM